jgi:hypothetical protein
VEKVRKGKRRTQDIRPLIRKITLANSGQPLQLRMFLGTGNSGSVRPDIVLQQLYGDAAGLLEIRRERLLIEKDGNFISPVR